MELLIETYTAHEANVIVESYNNGKEVGLSGIFMQAEVKNRNGRIYKLHEMVSAVQSLNETIKSQGGVLAEADHPANRLQSEIKTSAALITEVMMNGNNATGKMRILNTPCGLIVKEIIGSGFRPGVSSRGAGNVGTDGVVEGFVINSIDIVVTPSAQQAYPSTVYESLVESLHGKKALTLAEVVKEDKDAQKYFIKEIHKFLSEMVNKK